MGHTMEVTIRNISLIVFILFILSVKANDDKKESDNNIVILGVALSLTVIFAICGVFIGLYFKVERLCCCCRDNNEEEDQHGDKDYGGNLSIKQMSEVNNLSMIYPNNYSTQQVCVESFNRHCKTYIVKYYRI